MKHKIFIDGSEGTTGLQLESRLAGREDIELLRISPDKRKDPEERRKLIAGSEITFLCLPDAAAVEACALAEGTDARIIDASTAHRTAPGWVYGFPELSKARREAIRTAPRVAVPGCHATGFITLAYVLVQEGIISPDTPLTCHSLTGYSGGGKKMIAQYQSPDRPEHDCLETPAFYALGLSHKHLPEMTAISGLTVPPVFTPIVGDYYKGMTVAIPLQSRLMKKKLTADGLRAVFAGFYAGEKDINVFPDAPQGSVYADGCNDTDRIDVFVSGNAEQILLLARLDNLGKGSSGAAVECMDIMLEM